MIIHTHPDAEAVPTVWRDGLPLSAPARTLADAADGLQPEPLQLAVRQALRDGLTTASQLEDQAARQKARRLLEATTLATGRS